jgi:hypothetical protein
LKRLAPIATEKDANRRPFFVWSAAFAYFGLSFAIAFVLGAIRTLAVVPLAGEIAAVAIEAPIMLAVSWFVCRWTVTRFDVPRRIAPRACMGALAFALLMAAEFSLAVLAFGRTPSAFLASFGTVAGAIGLAAQMGYGLMPIWELWTGRDRAASPNP